ncbi:MAG: Gfo/Idh/MocA family oxidoreductase [Planctomycetaceae bacterium]|jgi:predicted dehydrogenase|nr:Gfo/Idh/MocA family oxidoreductase [Planctomycetaceae bacterium]
MHLTSEQRSIGQENFYAAIGSDLLRRDILKEVNAKELQSGKGLGAKFFGYGTVEKPVRVAVFGTGDEGSVLINAINPKYVQVVAIADIRPFNQHRAFHGDVSSPAAQAARCGLIAKYGWKDEDEARQKVKVFGDYNELLEFYKGKTGEESIEAVIIGLPLFLHAPAAIAAMKQGYHVLTEKLMAHTVAQCKEMARAAVEYKKHCAIGHQRHYNVLYDHAVKMLQSGVLGDLHYIRAQWHRNNRPGSDSWKQPMPKEIRKEDGALTGRLDRILANYEKKLEDPKLKAEEKILLEKQIAQTKAQIADGILVSGGEYRGFQFKTAEAYGYKTEELHIEESEKPYNRPAAEELIRWRLYDRTSAGLMAELGSHQLDAASIFIAAMHDGKKQYPLSVSATATRTIFPSEPDSPIDRDVDDHIHCVFDYAGPGYNKMDELGKQRKITVAYSSINGNGFGGYGETVFGTKGTLLIETEKEALLYQRNEVEKKTKITVKGSGAKKELLISPSDDGDPLSAAIGLQATYGDVSRGYCEEIEHWAFCIRENPEADHRKAMPRCYPEVALADAVIALTTNIAAKVGNTVEFDPAWFDAAKDETPEAVFAEAADEKKRFTPDLKRYA